ECTPDLVIMNTQLGGHDALAVLGLLRSNPALKAVPVIAVSADSAKHRVVEAARLGIRTYILHSQFCLKTLVDRVAAEIAEMEPPGNALAPESPLANAPGPTAC